MAAIMTIMNKASGKRYEVTQESWERYGKYKRLFIVVNKVEQTVHSQPLKKQKEVLEKGTNKKEK